MDETLLCKCGCFCSAANAQSMEAAAVQFSSRAGFANSQAMDTATLLNANFQATATNTLNKTNESELASFVAALNTVVRTPTG